MWRLSNDYQKNRDFVYSQHVLISTLWGLL